MKKRVFSHLCLTTISACTGMVLGGFCLAQDFKSYSRFEAPPSRKAKFDSLVHTLSSAQSEAARIETGLKLRDEYIRLEKAWERIVFQRSRETMEYLKQFGKEELLRNQLSGTKHELSQADSLRRTQQRELEKSGVELDRQREENARRKKEIDLLARNMQLQTSLNASLLESEKSTRLYYLSGLLVAVLAILGLYNRYRYKKRTTEQLTSTNTQLQSTLEQLTRTQSQLIHAEKMATLGEMTAGIAHEIRNPLNFVNNFSEISAELTTELEEQLRDCSPDEFAERREALLDDIRNLRDNTQRIADYGKRANGIVSGMMMHTRGQSGVRQSVEINPLVDLALELAESGQQGETHAIAVRIEKRFHPAAGDIEVLPQEISRVLLNLMANAMYAVREKAKDANADAAARGDNGGAGHESASGYLPTIIVSTLRLADGIEIRIRDNGPGIPADIQHKIFQPFFTTKPTGSGTGLGLSMSYDIIAKGHGGTLTCASPPADGGAGAEFIITMKKG